MDKIILFLKEQKKALITAVSASLVFTFIVLGAVGGIVYANRADLINYLARGVAQAEQKPPLATMTSAVNGGNTSSEETLVEKAIGEANPAVVSIIISKDVPTVEQYYQNIDPFGGTNSPFRFFFGPPQSQQPQPQPPPQQNGGSQMQQVGGGSGFFVSNDGLIVTNKHVVADKSATYTVFTNDGKKYKATVVARDPSFDIAILRVKASDTPYLEFDNSSRIKLGQTVIAIGNALGQYRNSVSVGVVSGLSRSVVAGDTFGGAERIDAAIQTDAAINPGNSGGPLLDLNGRVVGVNVATSQGAQNIGFALPANAVKNIVDSIKQYGEIITPYMGIRYMPVTSSLKEKNHLSVDYGALIVPGSSPDELAVIPGSPADKAGLLENDIILEIDGVKLTQDQSLASIIRQKHVGDAVMLKVLSKGKTKTVKVVLGKAPN